MAAPYRQLLWFRRCLKGGKESWSTVHRFKPGSFVALCGVELPWLYRSHHQRQTHCHGLLEIVGECHRPLCATCKRVSEKE